MFIDVHCHIEMCRNQEKIIENTKKKNVKIITQGVNVESNRKALELHEKYGIKCCLGLYPLDALSLSDSGIDEEIEFIRKNKDKISGIGEVGMDFKEKREEAKQEKNLVKLISLSNELRMPIIVHS